jgi:hypothetical protein
MTTKHVAHQGRKNTEPYVDLHSSSDPENVKIGWEKPQKKSDQKKESQIKQKPVLD